MPPGSVSRRSCRCISRPMDRRRGLAAVLFAAAPPAPAIERQTAVRHPHRLRRARKCSCRSSMPRGRPVDTEIAPSRRAGAVHQPRSADSPDFRQAAAPIFCSRVPRRSRASAASPARSTPRKAPAFGDTAWSLISHLSLNYLSLVESDPAQGARLLREMLALYADADDPAAARQIEGVVQVALPAVRAPHPAAGTDQLRTGPGDHPHARRRRVRGRGRPAARGRAGAVLCALRVAQLVRPDAGCSPPRAASSSAGRCEPAHGNCCERQLRSDSRTQPYRFTLFAALRLLEQLYPERPRLGEARRLGDDAVRLAQPPHLTFAPADVAAVEPQRGRPAAARAVRLRHLRTRTARCRCT